MDVTLERILSLIPKKSDGKFIHGAKKEFAQKIGLESGNVVSDWISGRSSSYKSYVFKISTLYNVSLEWLQGLTDDPAPAKPEEIKLTHAQQTLLDMGLSEEEWKAAAAYIAAKRKLEENNEQ